MKRSLEKYRYFSDIFLQKNYSPYLFLQVDSLKNVDTCIIKFAECLAYWYRQQQKLIIVTGNYQHRKI